MNEICPKCQSSDTVYDYDYNFGCCHNCGYVWGLPENDPGYAEESPDAAEAIALRNIALINQWKPNE